MIFSHVARKLTFHKVLGIPRPATVEEGGGRYLILIGFESSFFKSLIVRAANF